MIIARQSTTRTVTVGPILDADGVAVTDGVVGDLKISKNGGAPAGLNGSATLTHRHTGHYSLALTASDLDTVGQAEVVIDDTVNAMPPKEITVVEEAVYDAFYAASALGYIANAPVNVAQFGGSNGTFSSGRPEVNTTLIEGSDATNQIRDAVVDDSTRIDASALNTLSSHDPGETIMGATDLGTGSGLTSLATAAELAKVPKSDSNVTWNATALASLQQEATDALNAYDPPTNAEMEARTLAAASYATAAALPSNFSTLTIADNAVASNVTRFGGTAGTFSGGRAEVNATHFAGTAYASATFPAADDATLAAIGALNNLSSAGAQSAAAAALTAHKALAADVAYDVTTTNGTLATTFGS